MSGVLYENVKVSQLVKKFSAFYGKRMFITALTKGPARSIQSMPPHSTPSKFILILFSQLFPQVFPQKPCVHINSVYFSLKIVCTLH
jgi:hypothetical protein